MFGVSGGEGGFLWHQLLQSQNLASSPRPRWGGCQPEPWGQPCLPEQECPVATSDQSLRGRLFRPALASPSLEKIKSGFLLSTTPHPKFLAPSPLPSPLPPARLPTLRAGWWAHPGSQQPGVCPCEQRRKPTGLRGTGACGKEAAVATEGQLHDERARLLRATESSSRRSVDALNS